MKALSYGFTLIELMIVVSIIAILAAIALPVYQDYTIRAKVTELVVAASALRNDISEAAVANRTLANSGQGLSIQPTGRITDGTLTLDGIITVIGNNASTSVGTAVTLVLTPTLSPADGKVLWECSTGGNASLHRYVPSECRH